MTPETQIHPSSAHEILDPNRDDQCLPFVKDSDTRDPILVTATFSPEPNLNPFGDSTENFSEPSTELVPDILPSLTYDNHPHILIRPWDPLKSYMTIPRSKLPDKSKVMGNQNIDN